MAAMTEVRWLDEDEQRAWRSLMVMQDGLTEFVGGLLRWDKSRLSQHLGRMEKRDLVTREPCPTDQRGTVVVMTPRGRELITAAAPQHVDDVRRAFLDALTPAELRTLTTIGDKVRERLAGLRVNP
jgi:DNA-binding MarR family transcriptional regulator